MSRLWSMVFPFLLLGFSHTGSSQCAADFTYDMQDLTFIGFDESTSADQSDIESWLWEFGDGSTSTQQHPEHTFQEVEDYDVCLTITTANGCMDQICYEVDVCELTMQYELGTCNNDDEIPVDLTINDPYDEAKEITVTVDGMAVTAEPVDIDDDAPVMMTVFLPGDGLEHSITAFSVDIGTCVVSDTITTEDCTSDCFLSALQIEYLNPTTHVIEIGDNFFNPETLTIEAGDQVEWQWLAGGHTTTSDATAGPDNWNSGELSAGASFQTVIDNPGTHPYYCIPHGSPGGVGMSGTIIANCPPDNKFDISISFNTSVADTAGYNMYFDGVLDAGSPFEYSGTGMNTHTLTVFGDGQSHEILIEDVQDTSCTISGVFTAPDCGQAPDCMLSVDVGQVGGCDSNDRVPLTLNVSDINGGEEGFNILVDGAEVADNPFPYEPTGTTEITVFVSGDGQSHTVEVRDVENPNCTDSAEVTVEDCSLGCTFSELEVSGENAITHTVEVQDFQFSPEELEITSGDTVLFVWVADVEHTSTSDAMSGPDSWDSGYLNRGDSFSISGLSVGTHPYYCIPHGAPGGVGMSGSITVVPTCHDDSISVSVSFQEEGAGTEGFEVLIDGISTQDSPYDYEPSGTNQVVVPMAGDGQSHTVTIRDKTDQNCSTDIDFTSPDCNDQSCSLDVTAEEVGECEEGEVSVELIIDEVNGGSSGFNISLDGEPVPGNPFEYDSTGTSTVHIDVPGDGAIHRIVLEDIDSSMCMADVEIRTTNCNADCHLTTQSVGVGQVVHAVEVRDFEFAPKDITVESGDIIEFIWVGEVEHTATSDDQSDFSSFDSGYLERGDTFRVKITEEGLHPYYCRPHGAPGGVGMSGTIRVVDPCADGAINTSISFISTGGSNQGFNVIVDGSIIPGSPFEYEDSGHNLINLSLPADGMEHSVYIEDRGNLNCIVDTNLTVPDCSDPCAIVQADFNISQVSGALSVQFEDLSIGSVDQWLWGFGDGVTSQEQHPFHEYDMPGTYTVCLFVQNTTENCHSSRCDTIDISTTAVMDVQRSVHTLSIDPSLSRIGRKQWLIRGLQEDDVHSSLQYVIYDIRGRIHAEGWIEGRESMNLHLDRTPTEGMYMVEMISANSFYRAKFIIQ